MTAAASLAAASLQQRLAAAESASGTRGRIRHSVCKWCYPKVSVEELAIAGKAMGLKSIELLGPGDWEMVRKHGLTCAITSNPVKEGLGGITKAFNRLEHHDTLVSAYEEWIPLAAKAGLKNVICFSGNRAGMDDATGLRNCAVGLKRLMGVCEKNRVTLVMELLNSRVDHADYMCDKSAWGVALCKEVGSESFKLLYDIYHMQIMEGDIIRSIQSNHKYFGHYHTGGNPGRHEIDQTQEIYYPPIAKAIADSGFDGYVAHEFLPTRDTVESLAQAVKICTV